MWAAILVGALCCYAWKLAGLSVPERLLARPRLELLARLLPVAVLAALVVTQTFTTGQRVALDARAVGVGVAALAVLLRAPFLLVVVLAAATTAIVRWVG